MAEVCVVFVSHPDAAPDTDEDLLRQLYGLTLAEARVAVLLVQGKDVKAVSDQLQVSPNTMRRQTGLPQDQYPAASRAGCSHSVRSHLVAPEMGK